MAQALEAPRPRRWFQFHLSTAVLLMFLAGWLLWMNLRVYDLGLGGTANVAEYLFDRIFAVGWPRSYLTCCRDEGSLPIGDGMIPLDRFPAVAPDPPGALDLLTECPPDGREYRYCRFPQELAINVGVGMAILIAAAVFLEWLQRRLARRRQAP